MYQHERIISSPISNNRLDYDERVNKSIVVPSLIEGTLDDVKIGEHIAIECLVDGEMMTGKGLKNFVHLRDARVPTWIMDNHNHAFVFWHEALRQSFIQTGSLLVHIDQHTDLAQPTVMPKIQKSPVFCTPQEIEDYTNSVLTIADFIVPALSGGLIAEAVMVTGEDRNGTGVFVCENNTLKKRIKEQKSADNNKDSILFSSLTLGLFPSVIVDLDLDYFAQGFDEMKCLETVQYWIERADIITIATSPLFIDQEKALRMLKSLQKDLVTL